MLFALLTVANAAEVEWSGHYRTRGLAYRNLSLSATNPNAIGSTAYADHRLRLQPAFHLSSRVSVHTQLDFLPYTPWGVTTDAWVDPVTGQAIDSNVPQPGCAFRPGGSIEGSIKYMYVHAPLLAHSSAHPAPSMQDWRDSTSPSQANFFEE